LTTKADALLEDVYAELGLDRANPAVVFERIYDIRDALGH
jgi:hypothetical protein